MLSSKHVIEMSGVQFGTSGARGLVEDFTPEVCAAFAVSFIECLKPNFQFKRVAIAIDNRPSSSTMARAIAAALESMNLQVSFYGVIPTPALAYSAMSNTIPSIMVTGSHIPFDRNGIKFYRPDGEITKEDEQSILTKECHFALPKTLPELVVDPEASEQYVERYTGLFSNDFLSGKRIGVYEHSSAGRDLYRPLFERLGAIVVSLERSDNFVPIDTEAVAESDKLKAQCWSKEYSLDFIFSTDGDGDRPLVADENGDWLRGDILGLLCAREMNIEALSIPVSCNTIISSYRGFKEIVKTKIGSPYVIAEFASLNKRYSTVAGFEANGGFLLGSDVFVNGRKIKALPTRDAVLPALMLLAASKQSSISQLVGSLPKRFTHSDRIQSFAVEKSRAILKKGVQNPEELISNLGFNSFIEHIDQTDGLRLTLSGADICHLRPSGNAPELRCYAEADSIQKAKMIVDQVLERVQYLA
ncbi:phosphomannomutase [Vibrio parahaemolyticus]|uniref:phosphomannomutase n=1 Tax=Vibrio parahaemolyticus TaxID=670 RepID=UPI00165616EB|nr:phosphomannomutase [Vibrio parahaemolyticus]MBC8661915.1 phosphomannomutase [Vibrio parahaemolyticus]MBM4835751.1 phosphomannomutase [Vibrio parahaemolyticus]WMO05166.1 phosphomannomutase [Vibrio parahaemolyticus]